MASRYNAQFAIDWLEWFNALDTDTRDRVRMILKALEATGMGLSEACDKARIIMTAVKSEE